MVYPHKWSPISYRSSAGQRKHAGQRPTLYRWSTQPTAAHAASLLQPCRSTEVNQTLHDVWPSPALVHYIYIFAGSYPVTEFCQVQNSLCVQVLRSLILAALLHGTRVVGVSQTAALSRGRHLYSAGRPSRWALAHILVSLVVAIKLQLTDRFQSY